MERIWTIKEILLWSTDFLKSKGSDSARLDSELLLCNALTCSRIDLYCHYDKPVSISERKEIRTYLQRRASGEPIAYILGEKEFWGRSFKVSPQVLIPRPETEHLVELALSINDESPLAKILDVGCGSGAIAVSLALDCPEAEVEAWDLSEEALAVASANASLHKVTNCNFLKKNALLSESWLRDGSEFDLICSNPPYIAHSELKDLSPSVKDFEPHLALFAEEDGYFFYRKIAELSATFLRDGGSLLLEIGATQAERVKDILLNAGWDNVSICNDLASLPRVVRATKR